MINDSNLINKIISEIENISFEDLDYAIRLANEKFNNNIEITASYTNENNYIVNKEWEKFNNVHIKTKKSFWDFLKKDNKNYMEAA